MAYKFVVSACLIGDACRYDGGSHLVPRIRSLYEAGLCLAVCPERLAGLPVPRLPCEVLGDRVIRRDGADVTEVFMRGVARAVAETQKEKIRCALLKARSPSCGYRCRYDGTFTHTLLPKSGLFAQALSELGIEIFTEETFSQGLDTIL